MYGGTTREYPGILSIPDTGYVACMYGGTTWEDPKYPGILSIPDTGYVVCMYGGTTREDPEYPGILSSAQNNSRPPANFRAIRSNDLAKRRMVGTSDRTNNSYIYALG